MKRILSAILLMAVVITSFAFFPAALPARADGVGPYPIDIKFDKERVFWGESVTATWTVEGPKKPYRDYYVCWDVMYSREEEGWETEYEGFDEIYEITFPVTKGMAGWIYVEVVDADDVLSSGWAEINFLDPNATLVERIDLNVQEITIGVGQGVETVKPTVYPANATDKGVFWTSSNYDVAWAEEGLIYGFSEGRCRVTVEANDGSGAKAHLFVNVVAEDKGVRKIALNKKKAKLEVGEKIKLKAEITPRNAKNKNIVWKSSDESVATVNEKGRVTAVGVGKATITAMSSSGKKATCKITVKPAKVKKITIEGFKVMKKGDTQQLVAVVTPDVAENAAVKWKSSDKKIATVTKDGLVTALKKGKVKISAIAKDGSGVKATITIRIKKK